MGNVRRENLQRQLAVKGPVGWGKKEMGEGRGQLEGHGCAT